MDGVIVFLTLCTSVFLSPSITFAQTEQPAVVFQPQAEGSRPWFVAGGVLGRDDDAYSCQ
jgi:hypothetical protein